MECFRSVLLLAIGLGLNAVASPEVQGQDQPSLRDPRERHLTKLVQLTFGGQNAEAYFSFDGSQLIFQSTRPPFACDQIFTMNIDGSDVRRVSTGKGRTTCAFFFPNHTRFVYASTHLSGDECPAQPDRSKGYVWPLYPSYDIFSANLDGSNLTRSPIPGATMPRPPSLPMAKGSSSPLCALAMSISTS